MTRIYIDLETIPTQHAWVRDDIIATTRAPGTFKKPESIAEWERDSKPTAVEEAWLKTAFDGGVGSIVAIGWAVDDGPVESVIASDWQSPMAEAYAIESFFRRIRTASSENHSTPPVIVGHNHVGFDLPFLWKRAVVHGILPPIWWPRNPKPWSDSVADTMLMWAGDRDRISMDRLCRILGIEGKGDGPTGADVWPMVQAGRLGEVASYCEADVERTRKIYRRLMFQDVPKD